MTDYHKKQKIHMTNIKTDKDKYTTNQNVNEEKEGREQGGWKVHMYISDKKQSSKKVIMKVN